MEQQSGPSTTAHAHVNEWPFPEGASIVVDSNGVNIAPGSQPTETAPDGNVVTVAFVDADLDGIVQYITDKQVRDKFSFNPRRSSKTIG